jgi:hypothetical protein
LVDASVTDAGLNGIAELANLEMLMLSGTRITDAGIVHLRGLTKLDDLSLNGTAVSGECLDDLSKIKNLRILHLDGTSVSGQGLVHLEQMPKLECVTLTRTSIEVSDIPFLKGVLNGFRTTVVLDPPFNKLRDQAAQGASDAVRGGDPFFAPLQP